METQLHIEQLGTENWAQLFENRANSVLFMEDPKSESIKKRSKW